VKLETTPAFDSDYRRLKPEHQAAFRTVLRDRFIPACGQLAENPNSAGLLDDAVGHDDLEVSQRATIKGDLQLGVEEAAATRKDRRDVQRVEVRSRARTGDLPLDEPGE